MDEIKFNDANDIVVQVVIEDRQYKLRLTWNSIGQLWTLHIWDSDKKPLLCNLNVVPNFPLLLNHHRSDIPKGEFIALTNDETITRQSFANGSATLVYVTEAEWYGTSV